MKVISILPAYYFPQCSVIETQCGHKHVRPDFTIKVKIGEDFKCYCESEKEA